MMRGCGRQRPAEIFRSLYNLLSHFCMRFVRDSRPVLFRVLYIIFACFCPFPHNIKWLPAQGTQGNRGINIYPQIYQTSARTSDKLFVPADKTTNYYKIDSPSYDKLLKKIITKTYKKITPDTVSSINNEVKDIATKLNNADRIIILQPSVKGLSP